MYSEENAATVCSLLEDGWSLRKAAAEIGVTAPAVLYWTKHNPEFAKQYARAREIGYMLLADEILAISDEAEARAVTAPDGESQEVKFDATAVARNRLRVDTRKWMLSKMLPKLFGDKIEATIEAGESVQRIIREVVRVPRTTDSDR